ncbi:hypothetical protein [Paracoccus angustae]
MTQTLDKAPAVAPCSDSVPQAAFMPLHRRALRADCEQPDLLNKVN